MLDHLENDFERVEYLQNLLIAQATGGGGVNAEYQHLRQLFIARPELKPLLPEFVRTKRDLDQFWQFIKFKFSTYQERRQFLWAEFHSLLEYFETTE